MSPAPRLQYQQEGKNQNTKRSTLILFDQHRSKDFPNGRPWCGTTEEPAESGSPRGIVGEMLPISADMQIDGVVIKGWDAPWLPEAKYVTMAASSITTGNRFRFDYTRMIADRDAATIGYYERAIAAAASHNLPLPKLNGPVSFQIRSLKEVGRPPKSKKLPEAAAAGDPWLLGFTDKVNEVLHDLILDEQGRSAEYLSREAESKAPLTLAQQLMAMSDEEKASLAAILSPKATKSKTMPEAA